MLELKMPRRPRDIAIAAVSCALVLIGLVYTVVQFRRPHAPTVEYFTVDDGKTYFALPSPHFAPFEYEGKEAVEARLFKGSDGQPFVGYLMKYRPEMQRALVKANEATSDAGTPMPDVTIRDEDRLYKRPGESQWVPGSDPAAAEIWGGLTDPKTKARALPWH